MPDGFRLVVCDGRPGLVPADFKPACSAGPWPVYPLAETVGRPDGPEVNRYVEPKPWPDVAPALSQTAQRKLARATTIAEARRAISAHFYVKAFHFARIHFGD